MLVWPVIDFSFEAIRGGGAFLHLADMGRSSAAPVHDRARLFCNALRSRIRGRSMETFRVKTSRRTQLVDVTRQVEKAIEDSGASDGVCYVFVPHTTAGVMINEHADPDVASDLEGIFDRLVPHKGPYRHAGGDTDLQA